MSFDADASPEREYPLTNAADDESTQTPEKKTYILIGTQRDADKTPSEVDESNLTDASTLKPTTD